MIVTRTGTCQVCSGRNKQLHKLILRKWLSRKSVKVIFNKPTMQKLVKNVILLQRANNQWVHTEFVKGTHYVVLLMVHLEQCVQFQKVLHFQIFRADGEMPVLKQES